jgi:hypothetical protein
MNPLENSLRGYLNNAVYASAVDIAGELLQRVQNGSASVRNAPGIIQHVRLAEVSVAKEVGHFEHVL